MRRVTLAEIQAAACLIALLPSDRRAGYLDHLLFAAHCADKYRKRLGRNHPLWGNGSLGSLVFDNGAQDVKGTLFVECLTDVCQSLLRRQGIK